MFSDICFAAWIFLFLFFFEIFLLYAINSGITKKRHVHVINMSEHIQILLTGISIGILLFNK